MANPTFDAADLVLIDNAEAVTNWSQTGQMGPTVDADFFVQGSASIGVEFKNTGVSTLRFNRGSGSTIVGKHLRLWVNLLSQSSVNTLANFGITVRVWDSTGTRFGDWKIGGSDSGDWIGNGFRMIVVDCDRAFDRTSATPPTLTDIQYIGVQFDVVNQLAKSNGLLLDRMMISNTADTSDFTGGVLQITSPHHTGSSDLDFNDNGGSDDTIVRTAGSWITDGFEAGDTIVITGTTNNNTEYVIKSLVALTITVETGSVVDEQNTSGKVVAVVTLQDIVTKDKVTDDTEWGHVGKDRNGSFEFSGKLVFGDASGANHCIIRDTNKIMIWIDNIIGSSQYKISIVEDTGTTEVVFGTEVGTGNDSKGVAGGVMKKDEEQFTFDYSITATDASPIFRWFGGVIDGASGLIQLKQTDVKFVSCLITRSGQVQLESGAEMREGFITDSIEPSGVGAIKLIANPTDPEFRDMQLLNNIHAMENEVNGPLTWDLRNIKFAGNTADIRFNHASGLLTVNILEGGDTPTTSDGGAGGTISIVASVSITITVVEAEDFVTAIVGARVGVHKVSDNSEILNTTTNGSGVASGTTSFIGDVFVRVRQETEDYPKIPATIASGTGLTLKVAVKDDDIYAAT